MTAVMACDKYLTSSNPRFAGRGCERCGLLPKHHPKPHPAAEYQHEDRGQPRNPVREQQLVNIAAQASGLGSDSGLWEFADRRALPGGVRTNLNARQEIAEEVADGVNYCNWGIEQVYDRMLEGDSEATAQYEQLMRCLTHLVGAWDALVRG